MRHFGRDLKTNPLWQSLSPEEQKAWRSLLNPERFYDPKTNKVINLPENYLGVAARIASIGFELGISTDREFLDKLLDRAAVQFTEWQSSTLTMRRLLVATIVTQTSMRVISGKRRRWPGAKICSTNCVRR